MRWETGTAHSDTIFAPWRYDGTRVTMKAPTAPGGVRLSVFLDRKAIAPIPFYKNQTKCVYLSDFRIAAEILVFHLLS
jgi:hypothetical protein